MAESFEKSRGIQDFIELKRGIEKEYPVLRTDPRLITVDGVDGSGKSSIAKKIYEKICEQWGCERVILVDITNLRGSVGQERLREKMKSSEKSESLVNQFYVAGVNRAYKEVILPALDQGKIVIVDRSEIDLLRFVLEKGKKGDIDKRKHYIENGTITHRRWAGHRVFVDADQNDIWKNLCQRSYRSSYDPQTIDDVCHRTESQHMAEEAIAEMGHEGVINIIRVRNERKEDARNRERHLEEIAQKVLSRLNLEFK